jgi:hypothetical protein
MSNEQWKSVLGYEGIYEVSNVGNIRLLESRCHKHAYTLCKPYVDPDGYLKVSLRKPKNIQRTYRVHRLVIEAFIGPIPKGMQTNHKNGSRFDNRPENLEIVTLQENVRHSIEVLGSHRKGERNPAAKIKESDVKEIRQRAAQGEPYKKLGRDFGLTDVMTRNIAIGKSWAHLPGPFASKRPIGRPPKR